MTGKLRLATLATWLLGGVAATALGQKPASLDSVMARVGQYVESYGARAGILVATERFEQRAQALGSGTQRSLISELAIVRVDALGAWQGFRDVTHVDGRPVAGREGRLIDSLLTGARGVEEARRLSDESARFNLGLVVRNFNVPTTALFFFATEYHDRFQFRLKDAGRDAWRITFRETRTPTFITTPTGEPIMTEGELWVDPGDGTILRTLLKASVQGEKQQQGNGQVDVTYRLNPELRKWLPVSMDEEWNTSKPGGFWGRIHGHAEYSNYRQFTTTARIK